ncbi:putative HSP20-like chaperone, increased DNA methylation [Helianthus anomalus]
MAVEIVREIGQGLQLGIFLEQFVALPKPYVRLFGAAANVVGRPLVNIVDLSASDYNYVVLIELPQAQFSDNVVEWSVNDNNEVTIEGQITPASILADKPLRGNRKNRVQLCPTEPWAISFNFPGPVAWWTASVTFTTNNFMEISVMKYPEAGTSDAVAGLLAYAALVDPEPIPSPGPEEGETALSQSEIAEMVDGGF